MHCPSVRSWTESIILDVWTSIFWFLLTSTVVHFFFNFFKDFHRITFTVFFFFQSLSLSLNFNKIQSFIVSDFTYEKCFEWARSVIPPETLKNIWKLTDLLSELVTDKPFHPCSTVPGSVLVPRFRTCNVKYVRMVSMTSKKLTNTSWSSIRYEKIGITLRW